MYVHSSFACYQGIAALDVDFCIEFMTGFADLKSCNSMCQYWTVLLTVCAMRARSTVVEFESGVDELCRRVCALRVQVKSPGAVAHGFRGAGVFGQARSGRWCATRSGMCIVRREGLQEV